MRAGEEDSSWLVVRPHTPARRWLVGLSLGLLLALALYVTFELGRYRGGFDALVAAKQQARVQQQLTQLQQADHQLRVQLAAAQEGRVADIRERAAVARTIGELQAQVETQQQSLEFYKGLVAPQLGQKAVTPIRVEQFHISALPVAQRFMLTFTLGRMSTSERMVRGTLLIRIDGSRAGAPGSVDLAGLTGGVGSLSYAFSYYQHIEQSITLPVAFKPDSVTIEVQPTRRGVAPYRQTFVWQVDPV